MKCSLQVSRIQDLFPSLWNHEENVINQETSIMKQIEVVMHVNSVIIVSSCCLRLTLKYRATDIFQDCLCINRSFFPINIS